MRLKRLWPILPLVVAAVAAAVWLRWPRPGAGNAPSLVGCNPPEAPARKPQTGRPAAGEIADLSKKSDTDALTQQNPAKDSTASTNGKGRTQQLSGDDLLVKARVKVTGKPGMVLFQMRGECRLEVLFEPEGAPDESDIVVVEGGPDGLIEAPYPKRSLLAENGELRRAQWKALPSFSGYETMYQPISPPVYRDNVLDFGELEFTTESLLGEGACLLTGQLVHSSGVPIADNGDFKLWRRSQTEYAAVEFETNREGIFATEWDNDVPASETNWTLVLNPDWVERRIGSSFSMKLKPTVSGKIVDFGRIEVNCALVNVRVSGLLSEEERMRYAPPGAKAADIQPPGVDVVFEGYEGFEIDVAFGGESREGKVFLPPAPIEYSAWARDALLCYKDVNGRLDLKPGQVLALEIALQVADFMRITVKTADGSNVEAEVEVNTFDSADEHLNTWVLKPGPNGIPVSCENCASMRITGRARGWEQVVVTPPPKARQVEILFENRVADLTGELVVVVPQLPAVLADLAKAKSSRPRVLVWRPIKNGRQEATYGSAPIRLQPGEWTVVMEENEWFWGYPDGVLSGPVSCTIETGKTTTVTLEAVAPPPANVPCRGYNLDLSCAGKPFTYEGPVITSGVKTSISVTWGSAVHSSPHGCALLDAEISLPLELRPPEGEDEFAKLVREVECRLEVRVSRHGKPVMDRIEVRASNNGASASAQAAIQDGKPARLWLPPGEAVVYLMFPGAGAEGEKKVEIRRGERAVVEFVLSSPQVNFNWDPQYEEGGAGWLVFDSDRQLKDTLQPGDPALALKPGAYTLCPANPARKSAEFQIEVVAGSDLTVQIPFVGEPRCEGEIVLPYPAGLPTSVYGYDFNFVCFCPAYGPMDQSRMAGDSFNVPEWSFAPDGVHVFGLHVETEIVFMAAITSEERTTPPKAWCVRPRTLRLTSSEPQTVGGVWERAVIFSEAWGDVHCELVLAPSDNTWGVIYSLYEWMIIPAGNYTLRARQDGKEVLQETLTVRAAEDKYFDIPQALAEKFVKGGLLERDQSGPQGEIPPESPDPPPESPSGTD